MLRRTQGFTLIELLIVVVIIGILAAIAVPKFANTREKAYVSSMKSDLRNLMTSEEIYYVDNNEFTYTSSKAALSFVESAGVSVAISNVSSTGWSAVATHSGTAKTCSVYWGGSPAQAPATQPGIVVCSTGPSRCCD